MRGDGEDPETSDPGRWKRLALGLYPDAGASGAALQHRSVSVLQTLQL